MTIEIVLLAMVAAFLGLRLYSVLGKRSGHEQEHMPRNIEPRASDRRPLGDAKPHVPDIVPAPAGTANMVYDSSAEAGMRDILSADRNFDVGRFVEGSQAAYGMILEAFWKGDKEELKTLCDEDVYESFAEVIDAREKRGEILENQLVRIDNARISAAEYRRPVARITVQFDADIAAVVKDKKGNLIGGSLSDAAETHDVWTFSRDLSSADPNWLLDETDEA
ncbi:Tim44/TimA family putative adaptor protein [Sphingorhabdus sp. M41]|uniref:Tim44/TimA family putative adaptor protein n=1 Tax=Sphingorhabdus sp. M41 TaxID=1806885 RepID=UPI00078B7C45|nr:Tim44/TimA family putative adaptor protein [Sphingorhabdus sp. M41]AMO73497.1 preprotein translocase subunit Tim44 [Sphingorhabdus sp. M41]